MTSLTYETQVKVDKTTAWEWITSLTGISNEFPSFIKLVVPKGIRSLEDVDFEPGKPMFRGYGKLFGIIPLPLAYSDLCLMELEKENGFIERSEMPLMNLWQHERRILEKDGATVIRDVLTFEPKFATKISVRMVDSLFKKRHRNLKAYLG